MKELQETEEINKAFLMNMLGNFSKPDNWKELSIEEQMEILDEYIKGQGLFF